MDQKGNDDGWAEAKQIDNKTFVLGGVTYPLNNFIDNTIAAAVPARLRPRTLTAPGSIDVIDRRDRSA